MEWVRDQAVLDTVIALKGIQPGDEIEYVRVSEHGHVDWKSGEIKIIDPKDHFDRYRGEFGKCESWGGNTPIVTLANGHYIARANIAAWRPGRRDGNI